MIGALLTSFFWAFSAVFGQRAARYMGSLTANVTRLIMAVAILGIIVAIGYRDTFSGPTFKWLFLSGVVGFGAGDVALYLALARLGSRLTVLITFCVAPVFAVVGEWLWLNQLIPVGQGIAAAFILLGVSLTLKPSSPDSERYGHTTLGLVMAFVAAAGQGIGAVMSRVANTHAETLSMEIHGLSQAFQRVSGGVVFSILVYVIVRLATHAKSTRLPEWSPRTLGWLTGTALCGPVIGVAFYQWGLQTTHSAIVLAIVALVPILVMPLAWWLEKDRPPVKAWIGAAIGVGGVIAIGLLRT